MEIKNKFLKDNIILLGATMFLNATGFLFHFIVGRNFGVENYGIFSVILAIMFLLAIPTYTLQTTIAKNVSELNAENRKDKIAYLLRHFFITTFIFGFAVTFLYLLFGNFITEFFNVTFVNILSSAGFVLSTLLLTISRGAMQGLQKFKDLGINIALEGIFKLALISLVIFLSLGINGAILVVVLEFFLSFLISIRPIKEYFRIEKAKFDIKPVYISLIPITLAILSLVAIQQIDVLLIKHFFDSFSAGYYSAISLIGGTIYFGTVAISQVMLPKTAEANKKKEEHKSILLKSLILVGIVGGCALAFYSIFPEFVISLLYGKEFLALSGLLWKYSLFTLIFAIAYTISMYNLSIGKKSFIWILFIFLLVKIIGITLFHESISQVINVLIISNIFMTAILLFNALKDYKKVENPSNIQQ